MSRYDSIGSRYSTFRQADRRIVEALTSLLELPPGALLADIGAGTGNYSNALADKGYRCKAVEPSSVMRQQAIAHGNVEWLEGCAESIPIPDGAVEGLICILALHHFADLKKAASEMCRVCAQGPIILFTIDPRESTYFWFKNYFPSIYEHLFDAFIPTDRIVRIFNGAGKRQIVHQRFPLPGDLADLNMHACWNRPELYLDPEVRKGMSGFALADTAKVEAGLKVLRRDLESGVWDERYGNLRSRDSLDLGFHFLRIDSMAGTTS